MSDIDPRYPLESGSGSGSDTEWEPQETDTNEYAEEDTPSQENLEGAFDSEPQEEVPTAEEEPAARPSTQGTFAAPPGVPDVLREKLTELLGEEGVGVMDAYLQTVLGQREQYSAIANYHVHQDAQQHPDWHREYGGSLNRIMGAMHPSARGTKEGLDAAKIAVVYEEAQVTGDWAGTLERHAAMLRGKGQNTRQQATGNRQPSPSVMAQNERVPSGGTAGATRPAPSRAPGKTTIQGRMEARWGKSNAAALLEEE